MISMLWSEGWFVSIINHLWQSTLVALTALLLTWMLKRNRASTRYWIWMIASAKLLVPFSLIVSIAEWLHPAVAPLTRSHQVVSSIMHIAQPFSANLRSTDYVNVIGVPIDAGSSQHGYGYLLPALFLTVWISGFLFLLARWARNWRTVRATVRGAIPVALPTCVPMLVSPLLVEPGVFGIFRPVLVLPRKIVKQLSAPQLRSIVTHELCHVYRRDNLTAAIHMVVESIFWFHPAVWWIGTRLIEEREWACDEAVLQMGNNADVYAQSILNVCKICTETPMACMSGVTGSDLKRRIVRIMTAQAGRELNLSRKLLLSAVAMIVIALPTIVGFAHAPQASAQSAPAKNIGAIWQGILHSDRDQHFVFKISDAGDGMLHATFFNIDGEPGGIPVISTTLHGASLTMELPFATYQGTLSIDGNSVVGTWTAGSHSQQLTLERATQTTEWTIPQAPQRLPPMATDANPSFEVSSIRPSRPDEHGPRFHFEGRRFSVVHISLSQLVQFSYGLQEREIVGAPEWFNSESYNISAVPNGEGEPSIKQWQSMVNKLMMDRFQFKFHYEKRELSVYALTLAKTGSKLAKSQGDPSGPPGLGFGPGNFGATNATIADIAEAMQQGAVDRPVVDQTGLTGRFDLRLTWKPDGPSPAADNPNDPADLFTAIQEQLGLKLISTRAPVNVLVVDHVERPSEN